MAMASSPPAIWIPKSMAQQYARISSICVQGEHGMDAAGDQKKKKRRLLMTMRDEQTPQETGALIDDKEHQHHDCASLSTVSVICAQRVRDLS
jgi:hypothetical protein